MQAIILSIGDELVLGQTVDTNSAYLSAELVRLGVGTLYHQTLADDRAAIAAAIRQAVASAELVLITGGLGPTEDDLTRDALADAMDVALTTHQPSVEVIRGFFTRRGREMPERNKVQAMHPLGSSIIPNSCGTAPGLYAHLGKADLYVTPGVPSEMVAMWERDIRPQVAHQAGGRQVILTAKVNTFGLGESTLGEMLGDLMDRRRNPKVGTTVSGGIVAVRVRSEFPTTAQAQEQLDQTMALVEQRLGPCVFGHDAQTLQESLVQILKDRGLMLATAESCTGGLVAQTLTDVPGASGVFLGGWVTYCNRLKTQELYVPSAMIDDYGAVSQEVARAMAHAALEHAGADLAVGITGVAGPDGGTPEKPVGLVWLALAYKDPSGSIKTQALRLDLIGDRQAIRDRAAKCALQMVRSHVLGLPLDPMTWGRRQPDAGQGS